MTQFIFVTAGGITNRLNVDHIVFYAERAQGGTNLHMAGGTNIAVIESTDEIDRLIRNYDKKAVVSHI
jgi:hypothetical protein